jgi:rhodanese-related sulfurtransferase
MDVSVADLRAALSTGARVIDVREDDEWSSGHLAQAEHVPMRAIPAALDSLRGTDGLLYIICATGRRSAAVEEFLEEQGIPARNVAGGIVAWEQAGFPEER